MSDLIDRRAAIDELKRISFSHWFECGEYLSEDTREIKIISSSKALEVIEALPSAEPKIVRCKDCKYRGGLSGCYCDIVEKMVGVDSFCSFAERRTDG